MLQPRFRIRSKIVLPFTLLLIGTAVLTATISVTVVSRSLESRFRRQLESASRLASQPDFALNPSILERMGQIVGADIVTFEREGPVVAGTIKGGSRPGLIDLVRSQEVEDRLFATGDAVVFREIEHEGRPYTIAYRPLRDTPDSVVAFVADTSDIREARLVVVKTTAVLTVILAVALSLLSQWIARSITYPVEQLVQQTRQLAQGDLESKADIRSNDEIGHLARSFNDMAKQLRLTEDKALHAERLAIAGQLAARVAHDIRTPLSSIKMYAQILQPRLHGDREATESLRTILEEVDRANRSVQRLLHLARPIELNLQPGSINDVADEVLRLSEAQLHHRRITLHRTLSAGLPGVLLDADRLKQALLNLIQNSAEAFPNGGTLWLETRTTEDRSLVSCQICDDGLGIDPGIGSRVFDPFFTTKREGVGLGLVNTKSIVEGHGGSIEISPREQGGTCAIVNLPAVDELEEEALTYDSARETDLGESH